MLSVTSPLRTTLAQQFIKSPFVAEATGDRGQGSDTDITSQAGEDDKAHSTEWGGGAQQVPRRQVGVLSAQECLLGHLGGMSH